MKFLLYFVLIVSVLFSALAGAQRADKFRQLDEMLPTPNAYRTASGAPGHAYWQQKVDYEIEVALDEEKQWITGSERITYHNNSPDTLSYLWIQLDQNTFATDSPRNRAATMRPARRNPIIGQGDVSLETMDRLLTAKDFEGGFRITSVRGRRGDALDYVINGTMMRVDLPAPLRPGQSTRLALEWNYPVIDSRAVGGRSGREHFEDDDNWIYEIAQWYPRLAVYSDVSGWQNKQFIGTGEFALEFGDFRVSITVPNDHVVAATGELLNPKEVLSDAQRERLQQARRADSPTYIVTPEEAEKNESSTPSGTKTWIFQADKVRDFA